MGASTVNIQKMKAVAAELDKIQADMTSNQIKLDEAVFALMKIWHGEGADAYETAYAGNSQNFGQLSQAIKSCSATLTTSLTTYSKADSAAADAIKSKMAKG